MVDILAYRYSSAVSGATHAQWMVPICGFAVSGVKGIKDGNLLGVACFDYDYGNDAWVPKSH